MRIAASVAMATWATTPEKATRMTTIQSPAKIAAQRVRPPAVLLSAVDPTEPPTGMPRKNPDATLPAPWPMKSWLAFDGPSSLGADSATPDGQGGHVERLGHVRRAVGRNPREVGELPEDDVDSDA